MVTRFSRVFFGALLLLIASSAPAMAVPITVNATLTGDPRPDIPDDLRVLVTITGDTNSDQTSWTVDLDMAASHPDAFLGLFAFNLAGVATDYTINGLNLPYSITDTDENLQGSGNALFLFKLTNFPGAGNDATNALNLTFTVTKNTGNFLLDDFLLAPDGCSNALGCFQLGAHLQSLTAPPGTTATSGIALGSYREPIPAPEPTSMLLLGTGIAGLVARRRLAGSKKS